MGRHTTQKRKLDAGIEQHKNELVSFSLVSDDVGVLDLTVTTGELFDNMELIYLPDELEECMTIGKVYQYAHTAFKGACKPEPMFMFRAGVDPDQPDLFQLDPTQDYPHTQVYAFPVAKLYSWATSVNKEETIDYGDQNDWPIARCWEANKDFDIEELADFLETSPSPEEVEDYLIKHGAKPHTKEN